MGNLELSPGNFQTPENDDVWSQVRLLLIADPTSRRHTAQQPSRALNGDSVVEEKAAMPGTALPPLQIDQAERGRTADAVTVLNKLATNQDFLRTMLQGKPTVTRDDLQHQLDIDSIARANPQSPLNYLTSRAVHDDLQYAQQHWSSLPKGSIKLDHLGDFKSAHLRQQHVTFDSNGNVAHGQSDATTRRLHDTVQGATDSTKPKPPGQENLDTQSLVGAAESVIRKIDKHGDGKVTKEDLQRAMKDPAITGSEAQALAVLYAGFEFLTKISGDRKDGEPCLSVATMQRFEQIRHADSNNQAYVDWAYEAFDKYGGKDGFVKRENLENALKSNPSEPDKSYLQFTLKHFADFYHPEDGGDADTISPSDLWAYFARDQNAKAALNVVELLVGQTKIDPDSSGKLYGKETPEASIKPAGVNQSDLLTDCYMLGPLAEMAGRNPDLLRKMIKQNADGTYTVTFPGAPNDPITVPAPTEAELRLFNHGGAYGIWGNVFEKAFGQMQTDSSIIRRIGEAIGTYNRTPEEVLTELGDPRTAIKLLTGSETDLVLFAHQSTGQIRAEITKALNEHKLFVLGSSLKPADNIHAAHAYTIVALKPDGHGGEIVVMREPSAGGATIEMPLTQIQNSFASMTTQR